MRNIAKRFDATQALEDVSLALYPGEIHALLGENGAGKSTLIKIITGVHQPDRGEILLAGSPVTIRSAAEAQRLGVAAIYQEPLLFPDLNVAENIFVSHQDRGQFVGWRRMFREAEAILAALGVAIDVRSPARGLTLAAQQSVEIAKAISLKVRVLIMDEPTASLSAHEVGQLFKLIRDLRAQGVAILFVSHRIEEVFEIADKVTVFRDGRLISTRPRAEATPRKAIADMVGREMGLLQPRPPTPKGELLLSVRGLSRDGVFDDMNFDLHRGEVLGFAGLIGAGRTDVGLALFGIEPATSGTIVLNGKPISVKSPREGMDLGIAYVSEDRRQLGLSLPMSISANITLPILRRYLNRFGLIRNAMERATAEAFRKRLSIRTLVRRPCRRQALRRQPAEGDAEQMAEHQAVGADPRRADARHRRRRQGRGSRHDRRAGRGRHRHHPDLLRPSRGAGDERPRPGHARGPPDRDLRPRTRPRRKRS